MTVKAAALKLRQMLNPVNPSTNEVAFYPKADNRLYKKDSTGWETLVDNPGVMLAPVKACSWGNPGNITLSGPQTVDGVSCVAGDRVLLKWQTAGAANGIYVVQTGAWTRAADADTAAKIARNTQVLSLGGTNQAAKLFVQTETVTTIGTDVQNWDSVLSVDAGGSLQYPQPANVGHMYYDQNQKCIAVYNGLAWERLRGPIVCTSTTRPTFINDGTLIYETDTLKTYVYISSAWVQYAAPVAHSHVATAELSATGTKNNTTFLRGDDTWAVPTAGIPGAHASTHASGGGDPVALAASQISSGAFVVDRLAPSPAASTYLKGAASAGAGSWASLATMRADLGVVPTNGQAAMFVSSATTALNPISTFVTIAGWSTDPFSTGSGLLSGVPSGSFTFAVAGLYQINVSGTITGGGAANPTRRIIAIIRAGAEIMRNDTSCGTGTSAPATLQTSVITRCGVGEIIQVQLWQNAVAGTLMGANPGHTFQAIKLSD